MLKKGHALTIVLPPPEELRKKRFRSEGGKPGARTGDDGSAVRLVRELRDALNDEDDAAAVTYLRKFVREHC